MDRVEAGSDNVSWMELAQDYIKWWIFVLAMLNLRAMLPWCCLSFLIFGHYAGL
jgi:hypothetical protein